MNIKRKRLGLALVLLAFIPTTFVFSNCAQGTFQSQTLGPNDSTNTAAGGSPSGGSTPPRTTPPVFTPPTTTPPIVMPPTTTPPVVMPPTTTPPTTTPPVVTPPTTTPPTTGEGSGRVPIFVAVGKIGRTIMSCDDGRSWIRDRSDDQSLRCTSMDCDHHTGSPKGLVYSNGSYYASFGWGTPGTVRKSRDGYNWDVVFNATSAGGGVAAFGNNVFWAAHTTFSRSVNGGESWTNLNSAIGYYLPRNVTSAGNIIIVTGDDATTGKISRDQGITWNNLTIPNADLRGRNFQIAYGNGVFVGLSSAYEYNSTTGTGINTAHVIRSTDNGMTWTSQQVQTGPDYHVWSNIIFDGTRFVTWLDRQMWTSTDGATWTRTTISIPGQIDLGSVARSPSGTFVTIPNNWNEWYANQAAYRSTDGITWTRLSTNNFQGGHPIIHVISGYADAAVCQ